MPKIRLKHQLSYIERWRTDEEVEALSRGTLFHSVMEAHYGAVKRGAEEKSPPNSEDLFLAVAPLLYEEGTGAQTERQELVEWIYRGYVEHYGLDPQWEIIAIELPLERPIGPGIALAGTVDLVVRDRSAGGGLWIVDHKTCKNLPSKDFDLEDQTAIYAWLLKQMGMDIRGAIYNHCRTYKLKTRAMGMDERFLRQRTVRGDVELETCVREVYDLMVEAYDRHLARSGRVYDAPRSPDGERCGWKCGFTEACVAGRKYGPEKTRSFLSDIDFTQHDTKPGPTFNKEASSA